MKVGEIMTRDIRTCRETDMLAEAVRLMDEGDCGCLPVTAPDSRRLVGILTDRDVCLIAYRVGKPLAEIYVRDAMSRTVRTCAPEACLNEAEYVMRRARVRRLPVIDEDGLLLGILSLADLAQEAAHERRLLHPSLCREEVATTLSTICEPRAPAS